MYHIYMSIKSILSCAYMGFFAGLNLRPLGNENSCLAFDVLMGQ
jgi:hypothetical protein